MLLQKKMMFVNRSTSLLSYSEPILVSYKCYKIRCFKQNTNPITIWRTHLFDFANQFPKPKSGCFTTRDSSTFDHFNSKRLQGINGPEWVKPKALNLFFILGVSGTPKMLPQKLNVGYRYTHIWVVFVGVNVGKYTIH